jgi:hypothetical protein
VTAFGRRPVVLLAAGALLALLVGGAAPGTARAECGDHVVFRRPADKVTPAVPAKPCHGPNCSGHRAPILPLPAPPAPTVDERWGQTTSCEAVPAPGLAERFPDSPSDHPIRRPADIFHPPRPI